VTFSGRVADYATDAPVPGAVVRFAVDPFARTPGVFVESTTDPTGRYVLTVPRTGQFTVFIDGADAGATLVNGRAYRGDLLRQSGRCVSRYGVVIDANTLRPVRGATLTLVGSSTYNGRAAATGADGWYRLDLGCPDAILPGGSTFLRATHPDYQDHSLGVGRGVGGLARLDIDLTRR
jgi:hypothetical protein